MPVIAAKAKHQLLKIALLFTPRETPLTLTSRDNEGQGKSKEFTSSTEERISRASVDAS